MAKNIGTNYSADISVENNTLSLSAEKINGIKEAITVSRQDLTDEINQKLNEGLEAEEQKKYISYSENNIASGEDIGNISVNAPINFNNYETITKIDDVKYDDNYVDNDQKHKFDKITASMDGVAGTFISADNDLNQMGDVTTDDLTSGDWWKSLGKATATTAIMNIPGYSEVANIINTFVPQEDKHLNLALSGIIKEKSSKEKSISYNNTASLNDLKFYTGIHESELFGALSKDPTNFFKATSKNTTSEGTAKNGSFANFFNGLLDVGKNFSADLLGFSSWDDMIDWGQISGTDADWKLSEDEIVTLNSITFDNFYYTRGVTPKYKKSTVIYSKLLKEQIKNNPAISGGYLGSIYVEPFMNSSLSSAEKSKTVAAGSPFNIPFEFNPEIQEGGIKAEYKTETILGKSLAARYYINTDSEPVTLKTKYLIMTPNEQTISADAMQNGFTVSEWQRYWTTNKIREIELLYRSLVFPFRDTNYLIKPPVIQIYLGTTNKLNPTIFNILSYPDAGKGSVIDGHETFERKIEDKYFEYTQVFTDKFNKKENEDWYKGGYNSVKRYVVQDVKIEDLENTQGWNYTTNTINNMDENFNSRRGFQVTLTLLETTRNFLDTIPDFATYFNAAKTISELGNTVLWSSNQTIYGDNNDEDIRTKIYKEAASVDERYKELLEKQKAADKAAFKAKLNFQKEKSNEFVIKSAFDYLEKTLGVNNVPNSLDELNDFLKNAPEEVKSMFSNRVIKEALENASSQQEMQLKKASEDYQMVKEEYYKKYGNFNSNISNAAGQEASERAREDILVFSSQTDAYLNNIKSINNQSVKESMLNYANGKTTKAANGAASAITSANKARNAVTTFNLQHSSNGLCIN